MIKAGLLASSQLQQSVKACIHMQKGHVFEVEYKQKLKPPSYVTANHTDYHIISNQKYQGLARLLLAPCGKRIVP